MKLLIDNQLPVRLALRLRPLGHDCRHVLEVGLDRAGDMEVWEYCAKDQRVLVSKDEDFCFLANRPGDQGRLLWVRLGNCRNEALLAAFDRVHAAAIAEIEGGQRVVEIR